MDLSKYNERQLTVIRRFAATTDPDKIDRTALAAELGINRKSIQRWLKDETFQAAIEFVKSLGTTDKTPVETVSASVTESVSGMVSAVTSARATVAPVIFASIASIRSDEQVIYDDTIAIAKSIGSALRVEYKHRADAIKKDPGKMPIESLTKLTRVYLDMQAALRNGADRLTGLKFIVEELASVTEIVEAAAEQTEPAPSLPAS